ncbi:MAG: zinc ribbon domain-containing protein [Muribaculaceae bacterium]|nr:zinc ribbon domain-containing protein [Muribaculaceae bacterium]
MRCKNCGWNNPDSAKVCEKCKARFKNIPNSIGPNPYRPGGRHDRGETPTIIGKNDPLHVPGNFYARRPGSHDKTLTSAPGVNGVAKQRVAVGPPAIRLEGTATCPDCGYLTAAASPSCPCCGRSADATDLGSDSLMPTVISHNFIPDA